MKFHQPFHVLAHLCCLGQVATAQTTSTWSLAGDGNWKAAANWDSAAYPDNGQPAPGDTYNAVLNTNRTITLDGSVAIQGLTQSTGTITGAADKTLTLAGPLAWSGGRLDGGMTVQLNGSSTFSSTSNRELAGGTVFNNAGTMSWTAGNIGNNFGNFTFNNQSGGVMNVNLATAQALGALNDSKVFNNAGSLVKTGASYVDFQLPTHNSGAIDLQQGKIEWRGGSNTGTVTVAAGAELRMPTSSAFTQSGSGSLTGAGSVTFYSGSAPSYFNAGTYNVAASNTWGGDVHFNIPAQTGTLYLGNPFGQPGGRLFGSGSLTVTGLMTWTGNGGWPNYNTGILGSMQVHAQGGITMDGNMKPLDGNSRLHNYATATWSSGSIAHTNWFGSGTASWIINHPGASFLMSGPGNIDGDHTVSGFSNSGVFTRDGDTGEARINSRFVNNATGTLNLNTGSLRMSMLVNKGTVNVNSGTLWMQNIANGADFRQTGTFNLATDTTLRFGENGGTFNVGGGAVVTGAGGVTIGSTTVNFESDATFSASGPVSLTSGNANFATNPVFSSLSLSGGTFGGSGNPSVSGPMSWNNATVDGSPGTTLDALGGLTLDGGNRAISTRELRNHGTATWSSGQITGSNGAVIRNLAGATFTNNFGGNFSHGANALVAFINEGHFAKSNGTTTFGTNTDFNNSGTVSVSSGTLAFSGILQNYGEIELAGGTLQRSGAMINPGVIRGHGGFTGTLTNNGTLRAAGGMLLVNGDIFGSGDVEIQPGASMLINGPEATIGTLNHAGNSLVMSGEILVHEDFVNANAGTGNAYNPRANMSNEGDVVVSAAGNSSQSVAGDHVANGTLSAPTLNLGALRSGQNVTRNFTINNPGTSGPMVRGALQTTVGGANISDPRLSGSGVTPGGFAVAPGASTAAFTVHFSGTTIGPLTNQKIYLRNNFDDIVDQTLALNGTVWGLAVPQITSTTPITFGNVRVNKELPHLPIAIKNNAPADGSHEGLSVTPQYTDVEPLGPGAIAALAPQATDDSSIAVRINTAVPGPVAGSVALGFESDGTGTSGITPNQPLPGQTVDVTGTVYALASPAFAETTHDFGAVRVGDTIPPFVLELSNAAGPYREGLNASFAPLTVPPGFQASGSVPNLAPGASSTALQVTMDTTTSGPRDSEALRVNLASDGVATGETPLNLNPAKITLAGSVWNPAVAAFPGASPTLNLGSFRVGSVVTGFIPVKNNAPDDGFSEDLFAEINDYEANGGLTDMTASGEINSLAPQATAANAVQVWLDPWTAGPINAWVSFNMQSLSPAGLPSLDLPQGTVNLSASIFRKASGGAPNQIIGYLRQGESNSLTGNIRVTNHSSNDGYSERLRARIATTGVNLQTVNGETPLIDPGSNDSSLSVTMTGLVAASPGNQTGSVNINFASDGTGTPATSGLPEIANGSTATTVTVRVHEPAQNGLGKASGSDGTTFGNKGGGGFIGSFGSAPQHQGPRNLVIRLRNGLIGSFRDNLKATFDTSAMGPFAFALNGAMPADGITPNQFHDFTVTINPVGLPPGPASGTLVIHPVSWNPTSELALAPVEIDFTATIPDSYQAWTARYNLTGDDALAESDPDNDGDNNYKEFAFGSKPNDPASSPLFIPRILADSSGKFLAVLVRIRKGGEAPFTAPAEPPPSGLAARAVRDGVRYTARGSTAPGSGTALPVQQLDPPFGFGDIAPPSDFGLNDVVLRFNSYTVDQPTGFLRIEAGPDAP